MAKPLSNFLIILTTIAILIFGAAFVMQSKQYDLINETIALFSPILLPPEKLANPPEIIKAVYVTGYSAGTRKYLNYLSNLFKNTGINAVVVDIKDSTGYIFYEAGIEEVKKYNLYNGAIKDVDGLIRFFHDQNVYVIARIAVFEDPMYANARPDLAIYNEIETKDKISPILWKDNKGLAWLDPASKEVWDYNISLANDALYHGFDEVNFDYIRFPSDGSEDTMGFPFWDTKTLKINIIKDFFVYLRENLKGEKISADLFGQITTNIDGLGIGQLLENAFGNFDYISPMVYPSHYAENFMGFENPAEHPYEIVKYSMQAALTRERTWLAEAPAGAEAAKLRPWLQDFNMGTVYTSDMVRQEIQAVKDALGDNYKGFMLWNPSNVYTEEAIQKNTVQQR